MIPRIKGLQALKNEEFRVEDGFSIPRDVSFFESPCIGSWFQGTGSKVVFQEKLHPAFSNFARSALQSSCETICISCSIHLQTFPDIYFISKLNAVTKIYICIYIYDLYTYINVHIYIYHNVYYIYGSVPTKDKQTPPPPPPVLNSLS